MRRREPHILSEAELVASMSEVMGTLERVDAIFDGGPWDTQVRLFTRERSGPLPRIQLLLPGESAADGDGGNVYLPTGERDAHGRYVYRPSDTEVPPRNLANATGDGPWVRLIDGPVNVPPPVDRTTAARLATREEIHFLFGSFALFLPVIALLIAAVGVRAGLVTFLEAGIAVALTTVFLAVLLFAERTRFGAALGYVAIQLPASALAWLASVPVLGPLAKLVGLTYLVWFPVAILAVVAIVL